MVAVTSGANMNFDRLRLVTELADLGANVGIQFPLPCCHNRHHLAFVSFVVTALIVARTDISVNWMFSSASSPCSKRAC